MIENLRYRNTRQNAVWALISGGASTLPELQKAYDDPQHDLHVKIRLVQAVGRIKHPQSISILKSLAGSLDLGIRSLALRGLTYQHYQAVNSEQSVFRALIREEAAIGARLSTFIFSQEREKSEAYAPLKRALREEFQGLQDRVFCLVACLYDTHMIEQIQATLRPFNQQKFKGDSEERLAYAIEALDLLLSQADKEVILPLLQPQSDSKRAAQLNRIFPQQDYSSTEVVHELLEREAVPITDWTKACANYAVGFYAREDTVHQGRTAMLLTVEKVIILKSVAIFSETPESVLANLAQVLEEVNVGAGELILKQGDLGNSLFIIIEGEVRVHAGDQTLTVLSDRDVFGEMALLDPEPRSASITALKDSRLLKLEQDAFKELLDEQMEISLGIMRVLTRRLRSMNVQAG